LEFYTVSDAYINYLKNIDSKVPDNYGEKRPYIGVLLEVQNHRYLAPLTSYKAKQDNIKSSNPTIFKLYEKGNENNKLGLIHLNNMIPVLDIAITRVDISLQEERYKNLLNLQLDYIKANQDAVKIKALNLYELITKHNHQFYSSISCGFTNLESEYIKYSPK